MLILWGVRRRGQRLGVLMWPCSRCGGQTAHSLTYVKNWFTVFFIPIVPLPTQRRLACVQCGTKSRFDKAQQAAIEEAARVGAARAQAIQEAAAQQVGGPMAPPFPHVAPLAPSDPDSVR
jgi:hypothetical protein